jgi:hypothetical protein
LIKGIRFRAITRVIRLLFNNIQSFERLRLEVI